VRCTNCRALPGFPCGGTAVAFITYEGGNSLAMCQYSLDLSLDIADEHTDLEPDSLVWLLPRAVAA